MPLWLGLLILVVAIARRPIEVRLWRAGRISDRTLAVLLLGRLPLLVLIASLSTGGSFLLTTALVGASLVVSALFYRFTLGLIREKSVETWPGSRDIPEH
jgi:hypothetical protein